MIDSATLELGPGLTVITGETGAGKTMVVTALGLLLGGRADSGAVRVGQPRSARVEGVAAGRRPARRGRGRRGRPAARSRTTACCWRATSRPRAAPGRSWAAPRCRSPQLADVAEPLVAVHGQSDQHRLLQPRAQRDALDRFGGEHDRATAARTTARLHAELRETERELAEVVAQRPRAGPRGRPAAVRPGRDRGGRPAARRGRRAGRGGATARATPTPCAPRPSQAREALSSDERQPRRAGRRRRPRAPLLDGVREHDPAAGELADRLAELTYLLSDVAADVASYASGLETDPARLAAVSERRAALTALTRKYGETVDEVLAWAGRPPPARCSSSTTPTTGSPGCASERDDLRGRLGPAAAALSAARTAQRRRALGRQLTGELDLARDAARRARRRRSRQTPTPTTACAVGRADAAVRRRPGSTRSSSCSPPTPGPSRGRSARAPPAASCRG